MTSTLEDLQGAFLDVPCMAELGDSIRYQPNGGTWKDMLVYADYTDKALSLDGAQAIDQDVTISALRSDIPVKPNSACRVTLARIPGKTFKPVNVRSDESGRYWNFELEAVNG